MELARFRRLLDAYGAEMRVWPDAERHAALRLLANSPAARRARDEAAALDGLLRTAAPAVAGAAVGRVLSTLATPPRRIMPIGRSWAPTAILAGMAVLGLVIGLFDVDTTATAASDLVDVMFDTGLVRGLGW